MALCMLLNPLYADAKPAAGDREAYFTEMARDPKFSPDLAEHPPFRNPVVVDEQAPTIDRLIGWYGRQPSRAA